MQIPKRFLKQFGKKSLSVFLALIMLMSTMSVCFGTFVPVIEVEAANGDGIGDFVAAVEAYGNAGYKFPVLSPTQTATDEGKETWVITNSRSYTASSYKEYELFRNVIITLDTAVFNLDEYTVCATHNNNTKCGDGWNSNTQTNKCTDWGYVKEALKTTMGQARYNSLKTYNIDNLLDAILHYEGVPMSTNDDGNGNQTKALIRPTNGTAVDYGTSKKNTDTPDKIWNEFTLNAPSGSLSEIIGRSDSVNAIPASYSSKLSYKLGTQRCAQSEDNCDGKFHMAIQDQKDKAPTTHPTDTDTTIDKSSLTAAQTAFGTTYKNYFATTDKNGVLAISNDEATLTNVLNDIKAKKTAVINTFGEGTYTKFLGSYAYARTVKNIEDALVFLGFQAIIDEINRLVALDYSSYNSTQLAGHLAALEEAYAGYKGLSDDDKEDILANYPDFKPADVEAKIAEINAAYTRLLVVEKVDGIRANLLAYENKWTMVDVDNDVLKYTQAHAAYLLVDADYNTLKTLDKAVIAEIAGDDFYGRVEALRNHLANLVTGAELNELYTPEYQKFNSQVKVAVPSTDSATLLSGLQTYDQWYSDLKALLDRMAENLSAEDAELLYDGMNTVMTEYMDKAYAILYARVETQINIAYDLYTAHKAIYGPTVHYVSLESYQIVTAAIGGIETDAYEFVKMTPNITMDPALVAKYEEMKPLLFEFDKFAASMGFDTFYELKMADIEREDTIDDTFRQNTNKDEDPVGEYITTDAQIEKIIKVIDTALTNPAITGALGLDLSKILTDAVEGAIISDGFINTVVDLLYPLVLKEFGKVFANDLPEEASGQKVTYNKGLYEVFTDAKFAVYPDLLAKELGKSPRAEVYADTISRLKAAYEDAKTMYPGVGAKGNDAYKTKDTPEADGKYSLEKTAWDSMEIRDEGGKLNLVWGVDAAKEAGKTGAELKELFYQTFDDAVEGLKPLLCALIANEAWYAKQTGLASAMGGSIKVDLELGATANSGYANLIVPIFEALGLSYTSVSTVENTYTTYSDDVAAIIKAILDPIFTLVDKIGKAPLDTILGILPNLCYALSAGMVTPLLSMLKTKITYLAPVSCSMVDAPTGGVDIDVGTMLDIPILDDINAEGINALLSLLGIDGLDPINQAWLACLGELTQINTQRKEFVYSSENLGAGKAYHVVANKADVLTYLAEYLLGNLDTLLAAFGIIDAPADEGNTGAGDAEEGDCDCESSCDSSCDTESSEPKELSPIVEDLLENLSTNPKAAMAAIVELFNFSEYETKMLYDWFNGTNYEASTVVGFNPATEIYLDVDNDWTREKAEYLYTNLETIINAVIAMLPANEEGEDATETVAEGEEVEEAAKTLGTMLEGLIGDLYSDETLTALARILGKLDLNALLAGGTEEAPAEGEEAAEGALDINALIKDLLGIDLGEFATAYGDIPSKEENPEYVHNFGVNAATDKKAAFINELVAMLAPLNKVLDFLLTGGDLTVFDGEAKVTLYGSDGYNTAIIPLLEALGCTPVAAATGSDALKATLNALVAKIDALIANPVDTIFGLLPGLVYFLTSNGLSTAAQNLLKPALVVIETVRPIIDVMDILNNIEIGAAEEGTEETPDAPETVAEGDEATEEAKKTLGSIFGGEINLRALDANFVIDLVSNLTGLNLTGLKTIFYDVAAALTKVDYTSASTLQTEWKTATYSADFDQADLLTVLLSFVVEWIAVPENGAAIDKLAKKEGIGVAIANIIKGAEITYETPNWMYFFDTKEEFLYAVANGMVIPSTLAALQYPNDWNKETAEYIAAELPELVDMIIGLINAEKTDDEGNALPTTLSALLTDLIGGVFSAKTLNDLVGMIAGLLENVADELLAAGGYLLNVDLVGLKGYSAPASVDTIDEFAAELANILKFVPGLVELLFLGDSYEFFNKSNGEDSIVISGGNGYAEGLALILEALGCENLPAVTLTTEEILDGVFASLAARINAILANPVEEILELLPNLIFFLNANGAGVALGNLLKPVNALLDSINALLEKPISIADLIKIKTTDEEGNEVEIALDLENLALANVVEIVEAATKLDLTVVEDYLVNFCVGKIVSYDSISVNDAYKMTEFADEDVITIILTIALIFVQNEDNAAALDELIGTEILSGIKTVFESAPVQYQLPAWYALDWDTVDYEKQSVGVVQSALTYPNDWTAAESLYLADNLSKLVDTVVGMIEINGVKYDDLAALIDANVNIYTPDLFTTIQTALGDLLGGLEGDLQNLVNLGFGAADKLLGADIQGLLDYDATGVNDKASFVAALTGMLMEVEGIVEWLLLGKDYELFVDDKNNNGTYDKGEAIITLNGAEGYAQGLSLILEALGVENLPEADGETEAIVSGVLTAVFDRVDEILASPVDEVIDILPNVIYFINANGLAAAVNNLAGAFNALALKLKTFGLNIALEDLLNIEKLLNITDEEGNVKDLAIGLDNLTLAAVLEVVEELTGLNLDKVADIFVGFALGRVQGYTGINGELNAKMVYDEGENGRFNKGDMLTLVVTAALLVVDNDGNEEVLNELIGSDIISAIRDVFSSVEVMYSNPDWDYCWDENGAATGDTIPVIESAITYPNDWTEDAAKYLTANLAGLVDSVVKVVTKDENASLANILKDNVNVFNAKTLNDLVGLITNLLGGIDAGILEAAGLLLNVDIEGLKAYTAPETVDTVEEFATELSNILNTYAKGVVEWLLLGDDFKFFVNDANGDAEYNYGEDIITINGAHGYAEGLALLLEALGCKNLPAAYDTTATTEEIVSGVLASLAARINEIFANPVEEVIDLLPNLLYFLNANGVAAVVDNLTAALTALSGKLAVFDVSINVNDLVNLKELMGLADTDATISLDNLALADILDAVSRLVGLDLTVLEDVLVGFALGKIEKYESVSKENAYRMVYADDLDKHDMITVLLTSVLLAVFETEGNAEKLDEIIGTEIIDAIKKVLASTPIVYATPDWNYMEGIETDEGVIEYVNKIVEYPNDWTEESAEYLTDNLPKIVDAVIKMIEINGVKYDSLAALIKANVSIYNSDLLKSLQTLLGDLIGGLDENLADLVNVGLGAADKLLGADVQGLLDYEVGEFTDDKDAFVAALTGMLMKVEGLVEWLLLGNDYSFFVKDVKDGKPVDFVTLYGAHGYAEGLVLLLEALGCDDLPEVYNAEGIVKADLDTEEIVSGVLASLANRIDEILANPVEEVLELLPNLIYFLDANGVAVVIENTTAALMTLIDKLEGFGIELDINSLVDLPALMGIADKYEADEKKIGLDNLTLVALLRAVSLMTGLDLAELKNVLVPFAIGEAVKYDSVSANDAYKMVYKTDLDKHDMVTVIVTAALRVVFTNDANADRINEMIGSDIITAIKDVLATSPVGYATPNWNYMDGIETDEGVIEYVNKIVEYPNDWTEESAEYLTDNLPKIVDAVIKMIEINGVKYDSLAALIKANVSIYNSDLLKSLQTLLGDLIGGLDENLADLVNVGLGAADKLLGADVQGLLDYEVGEFTDDKDAFVAALTGMLMKVEGLVEWLLLGNDYSFFVKDVKDGKPVDFVTLYGAHGYAEGLVLLLEALGCDDLPEVYNAEGIVKADLDTEEIVSGVLASLANRIDEILANPVEEVLELLPNLIYFLDANGVAVVIENTTAALMNLVDKLEGFGITLDINSLVDLPALMGIADKYEADEKKIGLDNLTLVALLRAVSLMTGLDLAELQNVLVPFAIGEAVEYDSVSAYDAYKMVYKTGRDKGDMISVIVTAALRVVFENDANAAKISEMIGNDEIIDAINKVFAPSVITYAAPDWNYVKDNDGDYMLTYPNNWNEETAKAVVELLKDDEFEALIAGLIDANYSSLSDLLTDKVNVFTTANLQAVVDLITNLLKDIDDGLLDAAGMVLGVDVVGLKKYTAPAGITTVGDFATELANVLNTYAKGVVEWLLLGKDYKFFVKAVDENGLPVDFITINGANGYSEGLALLLEALGCENLPAATGKTEDIVTGVLTSFANRIDAIFANPVEEVLELLPNLIYFLNTNGVAAVIDNTIAALTALLAKLEGFDIKLDINELVNLKKLMGIEDTDAAISLDNLSMADLLEAVSYMIDGLDLTLIEKVLVGFNLGKIEAYKTVSTKDLVGEAQKMTAEDYNVVTIIANMLLITISKESNKNFLIDLVGEDIYDMIIGIFNMEEVPVQEFNWLYTSEETGGNKVGQSFSVEMSSEMFNSELYGPLYTKEMAEEIADNFGPFVDNVLYLLGIQINGVTITSFTQLINQLLDGSVYNSSNIIAIQNALAGLVDSIKGLEVNGKNVGKHIVKVLKTAGIADLEGVAKVKVAEFTEDKAAFKSALCDILEPLQGALKWLLADEDLSFFVDEDGSDLITLPGAEGYAFGIIPLLEVLGCEDILSRGAYNDAVAADGDVLLTSIIDPLLARIDVIIENPAEEILEMLPNLIYFINSNGVDTVVKNTLNAVYTLLNAIEPVAKIDIYELIGVDLSTLNFRKLVEMLFGMIADATGYDLSQIGIDAIAELTVGTLESYNSANGKTAYRMVYAVNNDEKIELRGKAELVTVILRLIVTFLMHDKNGEMVMGILRDNFGMSDDTYNYVNGILESLMDIPVDTFIGMDQALAVIYYVFYAADSGVGGVAGGLKDLNAAWKDILIELNKSEDPNKQTIGDILSDLLGDYGNPDEIDPPIGTLSFFQRIINWFKSIIEWFKNLFN